MNEIFERAQKVIPGGVNSPVRAFKAVGISPKFIKSAKGSTITDSEGKTYLDYIGSWGPMILGHSDERILDAISKVMVDGLSFGCATELEVEIAEFICNKVPNIGMIRMVNSGTEAVMSALRLARGYTGRDKVIKFEGCYHGHTDSMLVKAGSAALTFSAPNSSGVTQGAAKDTLVGDYNDLQSVEKLFANNKGEIACVIVEPVAANMGVVLPKEGFLQGLRKLCDDNQALLIFDEVITGFRLCFGGAQAYFGVDADLVTYGKIIGGGLPVGAYGGKKEIMSCVSPLGSVYQAGTLSGNPLAMTAGLTTLKILAGDQGIYENISKLGTMLSDGMRSLTDYSVNNIGSLSCLFFTKQVVDGYKGATSSDTQAYAQYFGNMLRGGAYIAPAQFEAMFVSNAHTEADIANTLEIIKQSL